MRKVYLAYTTDELSIEFVTFAAKFMIYLYNRAGTRFSEINAVCLLLLLATRRDFIRASEFNQYFISATVHIFLFLFL